ncbi:MAG: PIN domain-containing protein, partial [Spirochaetota bacterium]|nr:PIN domain-containing protein [Spirochaetota bacterium]
MVKNFVLDTNVLIHNPNAIFSFADNNVVIPITVIEELDNLKNSSDKKGVHARAVLREIDSQIRKGALNKGAKMKNGGTIQILSDSPDVKLIDLDSHVNDNKILATAWHIQKRGEIVFFISKDLNARIKAEALGIKARDYEKEKVEYSSLYKGWREVLLSSDSINEFYKNGKVAPKGYQLQENEYALLKANDGGTSTALALYDTVHQELVAFNDQHNAMGIRALNMEQRFAFDLLLNDNIKLVTLVGPAGTGKTLIAIACGLFRTIRENSVYDKILVARPIIPMGKDIGYLPGSKDQKLNYWMRPIFDNL